MSVGFASTADEVTTGVVAAKRRSRAVRLWIAFGVIALALHLPGMIVRLYNSDEASIATMAMVLDNGGELYHQIADRKPPIVPYIYAGVFKLAHSHDIRPVRALGALVLAATAML